MSSLHDKLQARRGKATSDEELDAIIKIAEGATDVLLAVTERHNTRDSKDIITAGGTYLEVVVSNLDGPSARAFNTAFAAGGHIVLDAAHSTLEQALTAAVNEKKTLEQQIEDLKKTDTDNSNPKALGGSSDPVTQGKDLLDQNASLAPLVVKMIESLRDAVSNGASVDDLLRRAVPAGAILLASDPQWTLVTGAHGAAPTLKVIADARQALADEKDPSKDGSLAKQLAEAKQQLADANDPAKNPALKKALDDATNGMVKKSDVAAKLKDVTTAVNAVKTGFGKADADQVNAVKAAITAVDNLVK